VTMDQNSLPARYAGPLYTKGTRWHSVNPAFPSTGPKPENIIDMRLSKRLGAVIFGVCLFALAIPANASFIGDDVTVNYEWPNLGTVLYPGGTSVIAPGGTVFDIVDFTVTTDVTASNILVTFPVGWIFSTSAKTFDGVVITDPSADITGVSLASTNLSGYVASDLSFSAHDVDINFPYPPFATIAAGSSVSVDVQFASPVPEPAPVFLLGAGLLAIGLVRSRRMKPS
jgi:hypothetical protein